VESLSKRELAAEPDKDGEGIRDKHVRAILRAWVAGRGGDPKKAFPPYPRVGNDGHEIRKVRLLTKQQIALMAPASTGYADLGSNHHIAIYRLPTGKIRFDVISLFEASQRVARRDPLIRRTCDDGSALLMSLAPGDAVEFAKEKHEPTQIWRVQKIASKGQISLLLHTDASSDEWSLFEPMVGGLVLRKARKISIDPIGRIRRAND
jgi:CRISPR-associated endonuclease Csn1